MAKFFSLEESLKSIQKDINELSKETMEKAKEGVRALATQAHSLVIEKAQTRLKSTRQKYLDAVKIEKVQDDEFNTIWAVTLDKSANWIENEVPAHEMIDEIIKGGKTPKTAKDGSKFKIIPFKHNKSPSQMSRAENQIANFAKNELKKAGLDKVITDDKGNAKTGRVATLNITGPKAPVSKFNRPLLQGLTVYQRQVTTASGKVMTKRDVMTFRVISEKQKG